MINLIVTCQGQPGTRFDREYYVHKHLPLTLKLWGPYGLKTADAFFPPDTVKGALSSVCTVSATKPPSTRR